MSLSANYPSRFNRAETGAVRSIPLIYVGSQQVASDFVHLRFDFVSLG